MIGSVEMPIILRKVSKYPESQKELQDFEFSKDQWINDLICYSAAAIFSVGFIFLQRNIRGINTINIHAPIQERSLVESI
jgi:hypothetical protein